MIDRKKKLRITQITLLILGSIIIFYTYLNTDKQNKTKEIIISEETKKKIDKQFSNQTENSDIFYNIEYSGLDLAGNRYVLKSEEAYNDKDNPEVVNMKLVQAFFYFKDGTFLEVKSDKGIYNNKTLDMNFVGNIRANYDGSELLAQNANYSNSNGFLTITESVKIKDIRGTIVADKLLFDIKKQKLNIESFNDKKVNAKVNLK